MLWSALNHLYQWVWPNSRNDDVSGVAKRPSLYTLYGDDVTDHDVTGHDEPLPSDERRWFEGEVLSVSESGAAISGGIWWRGAEAAGVGERVRGEAYRRSWRHGWLAHRVEKVETFDSGMDTPAVCSRAGAVIVHVVGLEERTMVAAASCVGGGAVGAGYSGDQSLYHIEQDCATIDFKPHIGDWLVMSPLDGADVQLPFHISGDVRVRLEALRRWTMTGKVTFVSRDGPHCSVVDDQILFTPSAWRAPGQQPRCNDTVRCLCIENTLPSHHQYHQQQHYPPSSLHRLRRLQWRATHVTPLGASGWLLGGRRDSSSNTALDDCVTVVPGVPALRHARHVFVSAARRLPPYRVPQRLARALDSEALEELLASCPQLVEPLTADNYRLKLATLLFIEESEQRRQLQRYSMANIAMTTASDGCLQLGVPGLADGRPSLVVGDRALVSHPDHNTGVVYEGCIHQVRQSSVLLRFCDDFHTRYTGQEYNVQFDFSRTRWRQMHRAVETAVATCLHQILLLLPSVVENCYYQSQQRSVQVEFDVESLSEDDASEDDTDESSDEDDDGGGCDHRPNGGSMSDGLSKTISNTQQPHFAQVENPACADMVVSVGGEVKRTSCFDIVKTQLKSHNGSNGGVSSHKNGGNLNNGGESSLNKGGDSSNGGASSLNNGGDLSNGGVSSTSNGGNLSNDGASSLNGAVYTESLNSLKNKNKSETVAKSGGSGNVSSQSGALSTRARPILRWYNRRLNERQRRAVCRVLHAECRPLPYIIYGPPGTGKTVTLVECALQLYTLLPHSRLLIVTASNSAADVITGRLARLGAGVMSPAVLAQLCAFNRDVTSCTDSVVREYLAVQSSGGDTAVVGGSDVLEAVCRRRVVVGTAASCGQLWRLEAAAAGRWTHVLVDEAGCLTEPELLVPIALMYSGGGAGGGGQLTTSGVGGGGQLVLVGDPKQLGAVLQSSAASAWGLSASLLERLSEYHLYSRRALHSNSTGTNNDQQPQRFGYDPRLLTKLVDNYRSHRRLLHVPSRLFYDGELVACASRSNVKLLSARLTWLPRACFPLVFVGVRGQCLQEADSPSWFNPAETFVVLLYLQRVLAAGVSADDIGIIAPYRKHAHKLRELFARFSLPPVRVGSAEEFQGQERQVIILTTVRSLAATSSGITHNTLQQHHQLGFMRQPKRFNVCVTRAKSLLIVVGCPDLLARDECWGYLLRFAIRNGAYTGCSFSDESHDQQSDDPPADTESRDQRSVDLPAGAESSDQPSVDPSACVGSHEQRALNASDTLLVLSADLDAGSSLPTASIPSLSPALDRNLHVSLSVNVST